MLHVLIACEESQAITIAMRNRCVECYSCDIQDQSGGHPEWHVMGDVLPLLNGIVHYFFGDPYRKTTCFWVHDLPKLQPTDMVDIHLEKHGKKMYDSWNMATWGMKPDERRRARSKTYPGIALAIADQWINYIKEEDK